MNQEKAKAQFITFYSFKGGVGRSMALINTAAILAGRGFRVLVIDLDLEAPGLSYLNPDAADLATHMEATKPPIQLGFVDLLNDAKERGKSADLFALTVSDIAKRYTRRYKLPEDLGEFKDGSLHIMPAGNFDGSYPMRFAALNLRGLYLDGLGEPLIRAFKKIFSEGEFFHYILVDSRTGFSDEAGICTRDLADHLMILSGLNRQNVEGTSEFLRTLRIATDEKAKFQMILSPVPNGEDALLDEREAAAKAAFEAAWGSEIDLSLQIPYHPQLSLTEEPHIFRRRRGYLFEAYRNIERTMLRSLGHDAPSLRRRIEELLKENDYLAVLDRLQLLIRLNNGRASLNRLVDNILYHQPQWRSSEVDSTKPEATLDSLMQDATGRAVLEFMIDNIPLGEDLRTAKAFLGQLQEKSVDMAERLYRRALSAAPQDADIFSGYAIFLDERRGDFSGAQDYFKRAIEANPTDGRNLCNYAIFLQCRGDVAGADSFYKRAIEVDPEYFPTLGNYANFLAQQGDQVGAVEFFKQSFSADPNNANNWCNYGQFLAGLNQLKESKEALLSAFKNIEPSGWLTQAEICFSVWLVSRMSRESAEKWERALKFSLGKGFHRKPWSFDRMLGQAEKLLEPAELEYAKAMANAFLDESQVSKLEQYDRWCSLEPLDPATIPKDATS